jgi:hypothetical protein
VAARSTAGVAVGSLEAMRLLITTSKRPVLLLHACARREAAHAIRSQRHRCGDGRRC